MFHFPHHTHTLTLILLQNKLCLFLLWQGAHRSFPPAQTHPSLPTAFVSDFFILLSAQASFSLLPTQAHRPKELLGTEKPPPREPV